MSNLINPITIKLTEEQIRKLEPLNALLDKAMASGAMGMLIGQVYVHPEDHGGYYGKAGFAFLAPDVAVRVVAIISPETLSDPYYQTKEMGL